MKKRAISLRTVAAVAMFLAVFTLLPIPTAATAPELVTIHIRENQGPVDPGPPLTGTNTGIWWSEGAFEDGGDVVESWQMCMEPFIVLSTLVLTGADGSIIIRWIFLRFTFTDLGIVFEGRWVIVGGTGQYANSALKGEGTLTAWVDPTAPGGYTNFGTLEGSVKL